MSVNQLRQQLTELMAQMSKAELEALLDSLTMGSVTPVAKRPAARPKNSGRKSELSARVRDRLNRPLKTRLLEAEAEIRAGKGKPWREVLRDA